MRLRGKLGRHGFDVKSYDVGAPSATADFAPVYPASEAGAVDAAPRARPSARSPSTRATSPIRCRPSSSCRCAATRSPRCHFPRDERTPSWRAAPPRPRRAARPAARRRPLARRRRRRARRSRPPGELVGALSRGAAVRAHRASGVGDRARSTPTSRGRCRCSGCCRATSARARRSSRSTRCCARSRAGRQGALMAPTETLAEQHFLTLEPLCAQLGVRCVLLTGSAGSKKIARRDRQRRRRRSRSARTR